MRFHPEHDTLTVTLEGWERVWALKKSLAIPAAAIMAVTFTPDRPHRVGQWTPRLRFPGTAIPGIFLAGTYLWRGERDFWYLHLRRPGVLTIICHPGAFAYNTICLSCDEATGHELLYWWKARQK
ncbi:MAG TPA: hypothetical protein VLF60_01600 [Candidatus Saccharimonadales bacterium]|nr:hypothetical protein [Candidatus Saccharimonadales bacterium]